MSNLAEQIREALAMFARNGAKPLKIHRASLNMAELREYFALFNKPELLDGLLG